MLLINHFDIQYHIREGDRIAQLILEQIKTSETKMMTELKPPTRRNKGFGSSGISTCLVTIDNNDLTNKVSNQSETKTYSYDAAVKQLGYDPMKEYPDVSQKRHLPSYHPSERSTTLSTLSTRINTDICVQDAYNQAKHSYLS